MQRYAYSRHFTAMADSNGKDIVRKVWLRVHCIDPLVVGYEWVSVMII